MLRQMKRSAIHLLHKREKTQRQIARELRYGRETLARALREPVDRRPGRRIRRSVVVPYREQIEQWVEEGLTAMRITWPLGASTKSSCPPTPPEETAPAASALKSDWWGNQWGNGAGEKGWSVVD
jgi:hypothetical protein